MRTVFIYHLCIIYAINGKYSITTLLQLLVDATSTNTRVKVQSIKVCLPQNRERSEVGELIITIRLKTAAHCWVARVAMYELKDYFLREKLGLLIHNLIFIQHPIYKSKPLYYLGCCPHSTTFWGLL